MSERRPQSELAEESSGSPANNPDSEGTQEASSSSELVQQRIPEPPGLDAIESHRPNALVSLLSRSSRASGEVYEALTNLRELVSERVLREVRALEKSIDSKIESLKLTVNTKTDALEKTVKERFRSVKEQFAALEKTVTARFDGMIARFDGMNARIDGTNARIDSLEKSIESLRWMVGLLIALVIALIALVVGSLFFFRFWPTTYPDYPARVPGAYYGDPPRTPTAPENTASEPELADPEDAAAETPDAERSLSP